MTTNLGDSAVYKLDLKQAASRRSEMSYPIYIIFGSSSLFKLQKGALIGTQGKFSLCLSVCP